MSNNLTFGIFCKIHVLHIQACSNTRTVHLSCILRSCLCNSLLLSFSYLSAYTAISVCYSYRYKCIFYYALKNGKVDRFTGLTNDTIYEYSNGTLNDFKIAKAEQCQPKLYMHQITLSNESGTSKRFQYITSSQVVVNSIDNLTNLLGNSDVYLDTVQVLHKAGDAWRVVGGSENFVVSSVSDVVTPLK